MTGVTVLEDCTCEWRLWPFKFWRFRRRWHRCIRPAGHGGDCECACGQRLPFLVLIGPLNETETP